MNNAVNLADVPEEYEPVSRRVAEEVYPLAVGQARTQVVIQLAALLALVAIGAVMGFPRSSAFAAAMVTTGTVALIIDLRWWLWLRRADAIDAYRFAQVREDSSVAALHSPARVILTVIVVVLWLTAARPPV